MAIKSENKEWHDIVEHFAYRKQSNCIKLEDYILLIGGNYDFHTCTLKSQAVWIFEDFKKNSYKLYNGDKPYKKVVTFHFVKNTIDNLEYLIHVYKSKYDKYNREKVCVNAGVIMHFDQDVSFVRVYSFPCEFIEIFNNKFTEE